MNAQEVKGMTRRRELFLMGQERDYPFLFLRNPPQMDRSPLVIASGPEGWALFTLFAHPRGIEEVCAYLDYLDTKRLREEEGEQSA